MFCMLYVSREKIPKIVNMKFAIIAVVMFALAIAVAGAEEKEKKKITHLQIGVKKRVPADECDQKSRNGDKLHMHYTGTLYDDGSEFDSSIPRGQPFTFPLGAGRVIKGESL